MMTAIRIACGRAAIVGLVFVGGLGAATAQTPSPATSKVKPPSAEMVAIAHQIIELKGTSKLYDPIFIGIIEKAKFTFMQSNPMLQQPLNEVAVQLRAELQPELKALKDKVAHIYAERFTEPELKQALTFYKSPLGTKLLAVEPKVFDQSMAYAGEWAEKLGDEVMAKMRTEMRKRGHEM